MSIDVAEWLKGLGLEQYAAGFATNDIDADVLSELTAEDLMGIGVSSIGHRANLEIAQLRSKSLHLDARPLDTEDWAGMKRAN